MLLKDLTTLTASLVSGTLFHVEKSGKAYNIDYTKLAKAIVEEYNGSTLGGSAQTIQAAIGALNSSLVTMPMPSISRLTTEELIDAAYNDAHTSSSNRTWYRRLMDHGTYYSVLGGGRYYLEGYRETMNYGWQMATSYSTSQDTMPCKCYERSIINGTWSDWQKRPTRAEIDALNSSLTSLASTHVSFQRDNNNLKTFSFDVSPLQTNFFRAAIVIHHDKDHPSVHLLSFGVGTEVTASVGKIYGDSSSLTISSANINNRTITISFGATAYGGCSLFWLN